MRVLALHNYYQQAGGEDLVFDLETSMLENAGHTVIRETVSNADIQSLATRLGLVWSTAYSRKRARWAEQLIDQHKPDLIHVHNFFPLLSPAVHLAAAKSGVAVVQSLHNYRLLCAAATFMRDGQVCQKCVHQHQFNGIRYRCYRNSAIASAAVVRMQRNNLPNGPLGRSVDQYIALTQFARTKFIEGGLPADRISVKPNFLRAGFRLPDGGVRNGALFVGRLSSEKGLETLVRAWGRIEQFPLRIAGDGPLLNELMRKAPPNVSFLGKIGHDEVRHEMSRASFLVQPSIWFEGFPMTIVEAFASSLPVIASRIGSLAEVVEEGRNGMLFEAGNDEDLARVVSRAIEQSALLKAMGGRAYEDFVMKYSEDANLPQLERIYAKAIERRGKTNFMLPNRSRTN